MSVPRVDDFVSRLVGDDDAELLLVPGPVSLGPEAQREVERAVRPHYGAAWVQTFRETTARLQDVFRTSGDVILFFGPGSAALETSLRSTLHTRDRVLIPSNGIFGDRLAALAEVNDYDVVRLRLGEREPITAEVIAAEAKRVNATALAVVHSETGSGMLNPLEEICAEAQRLGLFTIVDAVSSLGGVPLEVEGWGIDVCVGVGNKCLGAPIGISPIAVGDRAWDRCATSDIRPRGRYFNLQTWRDTREQQGDWHPHPSTMPTSTVHALHAAAGGALLDLPGFVRRHAEVASIVRTGLRELGFRLYIEDERFASPVVTAVYARDDMDQQDYVDWLGKEGRMRISPGIGTGDAPVFRVAHMGLAADPDVAAAYLELTRRYLDDRVGA